jgi:hypothetical protein
MVVQTGLTAPKSDTQSQLSFCFVMDLLVLLARTICSVEG